VGFDRYLLASGATGMILIVLHVLVRLEPPHHVAEAGVPNARPEADEASAENS
jgi:hypothetical protein